MTALFATVFFASLLGSVHCAGMCGGFIAFYAGSDATGGRARWFGHLAYSGGRLLTYSILGVFAGWLGRAVDLAGSFAGVGRIAAVLAGLSMVAWGSVGVLRALGLSLPRLPLPARLERLYGRSLQTMRGRPPVVRAAILGLASTLLPCGWLYAFAVTAAGTASPLWGAAVMASFWLGTLPMLVGLGAAVQHLAGPLRRHLPAVSALALVCVGLLAVSQRMRVPNLMHRAPLVTEVQPAAWSLPAAIERVQHLGEQEPPCCREAGPLAP